MYELVSRSEQGWVKWLFWLLCVWCFSTSRILVFFLEKAHYCLTLLLMSPYDIIRIHKPIMVPFSFLVFSVSLITRAFEPSLVCFHSFIPFFFFSSGRISMCLNTEYRERTAGHTHVGLSLLSCWDRQRFPLKCTRRHLSRLTPRLRRKSSVQRCQSFSISTCGTRKLLSDASR